MSQNLILHHLDLKLDVVSKMGLKKIKNLTIQIIHPKKLLIYGDQQVNWIHKSLLILLLVQMIFKTKHQGPIISKLRIHCHQQIIIKPMFNLKRGTLAVVMRIRKIETIQIYMFLFCKIHIDFILIYTVNTLFFFSCFLF